MHSEKNHPNHCWNNHHNGEFKIIQPREKNLEYAFMLDLIGIKE